MLFLDNLVKRPIGPINTTLDHPKLLPPPKQKINRINDCRLQVMDYPTGKNLGTVVKFANALACVLRDNFGEDQTYSIVCRGSSGSIIASQLIGRIKVHQIVCIKKPGENTHGRGHQLDPVRPDEKIMFVDDFVCSGETFQMTAAAFYEANPHLRINIAAVSGLVNINAFRGKADTVIAYEVYGEENDVDDLGLAF